MPSLDSIGDPAMEWTHDRGRASLAFGGEWKTTNSASRVDATLFPFLPLHVTFLPLQARLEGLEGLHGGR